MSDINQDDIDKLLQDALAGGGEDPEPAASPQPPEELGGAASQDDIDALFAAVGAGGGDAAPAPAPAAPPPEPAPKEEPAPEPDVDLDGVANQDDIDALFAAVGGDAPSAPAPTPEPEPDPEPAPPPPEPAEDLDGVADQSDIDALFSAAAASAPAQAPEPPAPAAEIEPAPEPEEAAASEPDVDSLLSSIAEEAEAIAPNALPEHSGASDETVRVDDFDMEELLRQVTEAAPPPPPPKPPQPRPEVQVDSDTAELAATHTTDTVYESPAPVTAPPPAPVAPRAVPPPPAAYAPPPAAGDGQRQEFSVLYGAGEVESVANQISTLIATLSEKAHRYMQAWMASDSEARELRSRALAEERRRASITSERDVLARELDELRSRIGELEGTKMAVEESKRTLETSFQAKIRELDSQVKLLSSESESLKEELTRARNQATGVDIESRRARFEVDRLKNEVESERMERLRIQRALENREKEIQAVQAQAAGQASSLFIDELHRLVRRLETELETRSSGAHEALKQLDRLEGSEDMVPALSNLRAALMQAIGAETDGDDALKALGREASGVKGPSAVAPEKTEMLSFETALSTFNLSGALDVAGTLLREAKARPSILMRKVYQCPALRRPEIADYLGDLSRLLEGLRTIQESNDRARGSETNESEVFFVQMFDFLHNLVRLKLVNRLSGDIWRLFLDLRGRFSFVASDKQWAEYRDKTLNDNSAKA